jgi:iron complex outermembrane receptor protein
VVQDGVAFDVQSRDFAVSDQDRRSVLVGGRVQGPLTDDWWLEVSLSYFDILEDETRTSLASPLDPAFTPAGGITDYDDAGWETAELRLETDALLGNPDLSLVTGYRFEHYRLKVSNYDSADYAAGARTTLSNRSGGETEMHAWYAQLGWRFLDDWDVALGGRYERWSSADGFFDDFAGGILQDHPDRSLDRFSPKFSIGFSPDPWRFRYSLAKAYRFPIVEELFQNEFRTTGTALANASLAPEDGLHHNLALEYRLSTGSVRVNLFRETIGDVIFSQIAVVNNQTLSTFLPIDEVRTQGVEFVYDQINLFDGRLDVRFNAVYTDAEITRNRLNPAIEGNTFPRMPKWRTNLLLTWHVNDRWDVGGGVSHASDSYGRLDNLDTANEVYGAHDAYTFLNLKTSFRVNRNLGLSLGVDNLNDDRAFVHHPWPGRTAYLEGWLSF